MEKLNTQSAASDLAAMMEEVHKAYPDVDGVLMDPTQLVFEERSKINCYYCGRYNNNWHCPPHVPDIDFPTMFAEYDNGAFVVASVPLDNPEARTESSLINHRSLLLMEKWLWDHNNSTSASFIAGSCKLCRNGCGPEKCNNPYQGRSPLESTGCNVVKSAAKVGIDIAFPPENYMMRVGLIVW